MQRTQAKAIFALIRSAIKGTAISEEEKNLIVANNLSELFKIARAHDMAHLLATALQENDFLSGDTEEKTYLIQTRNIAVGRRALQQYALEQVSALLEEEKIPYLPLKGSVICNVYPEPWMRTSCDIDILVHKEDVDKVVEKLQEKHYRFEGDHYHDVSLFSEEGVHLELHYELIEERDSLECHAILRDIWSQVLPAEGRNYEKRMPQELFLFYHIAHMAKHFVYGGCGIRPFLDLWIMKSKMPFDAQKLEKLLCEGGLQTFYEYAVRLIECWFEGKEADDTVRGMETYVLRGGVYGTTENKIAVNREHPRGKVGHLLSSIFIPYENLWRIYPKLKGKKWLTPVYQVRRWFRILFKGMSNSTRKSLKTYDIVSKEQQEETKRLLDSLKLCQKEGKGF